MTFPDRSKVNLTIMMVVVLVMMVVVGGGFGGGDSAISPCSASSTSEL
jgi:hypothetical protein